MAKGWFSTTIVFGSIAATSATSWPWPSGSGVDRLPLQLLQAKTTAVLALRAASTAARWSAHCRLGVSSSALYLGTPADRPSGVQFAIRSFAAFDRVKVPAGRTVTVNLHVGRRELSYWSSKSHQWQVATGERPLTIAGSSRDARRGLRSGLSCMAFEPPDRIAGLQCRGWAPHRPGHRAGLRGGRPGRATPDAGRVRAADGPTRRLDPLQRRGLETGRHRPVPAGRQRAGRARGHVGTGGVALAHTQVAHRPPRARFRPASGPLLVGVRAASGRGPGRFRSRR